MGTGNRVPSINMHEWLTRDTAVSVKGIPDMRPSFDEFTSVVAEAFMVEAGRLRRETTAQDVPGWDSVSHLVLIATIEESFQVRFAMADLQDLTNLGALYERLMRLSPAA